MCRCCPEFFLIRVNESSVLLDAWYSTALIFPNPNIYKKDKIEKSQVKWPYLGYYTFLKYSFDWVFHDQQFCQICQTLQN